MPSSLLKARLNPPTGFWQLIQLEIENDFPNMENVYLLLKKTLVELEDIFEKVSIA